jgi:uncharacterized protein (TIGR02246 family)
MVGLIVLLGAAVAMGQPSYPATELEQIEQRLMRAWIDHDRAYVESVIAEDWVTTDTSGRVLTRAQVFAEMFDSGDRKLESGKIDDVKVRMLGGETAVVTGRTFAQGSYRGQRVAVTLRFTDVFVKRDGRWQAVASQGTVVAP